MSEYRKLKSLKFLYEINKDGVLRNVKSKKIVVGTRENNGYQRVRIENKCLGGVVRTSIHQLVAEAFIPNPNNLPVVNHKDLNKQNNRVENLEWVTHSQNAKHAYANGAMNTEALRKHSEETRKRITNGEIEFTSIHEAAKWLVEQGKAQSENSAVSGISAVLHNRRRTRGGYAWEFCV